MSTPEANLEPSVVAEASPAPAPARAPRRFALRRSSDILGLSWLHGSLHAGVFRRQKMVGSWTSPTLVKTLEEFALALDEILISTEFSGTEVFLVLEHEHFLHQTEMAPQFSDSAAKSYLQSRISRFEKEKERVLWISQKTVSVRQESAHILHILPASFYDQLNQSMLVRRLDLTRILPLAVPLQRELDKFPISKDTAVLIATDVGDASLVLVARVNGPLLFARTILASWKGDPAKIGMEVNRSLLYAKQQFATNVDRLWILSAGSQTLSEIKAKCGPGKNITVLPTSAIDLLQTVAKLSVRHPINLVASHLRRKQRQRFLRIALLTGCWVGLTFLALNASMREQAWRAEQKRYKNLSTSEPVLRTERDQLTERNKVADRERLYVRQISGDRLPPVAGRFLAFVATVLPKEIRLTDFLVKFEGSPAVWSFRLEGVIESEQETARETVTDFQTQLAASPVKARIPDAGKTFIVLPVPPGSLQPAVQRFSLEGTLFEK